MKATILSCCLIIAILSACSNPEPQDLGFTNVAWNKMSLDTQANYLIKYRNNKSYRERYVPQRLNIDRSLSVLISGGTAKMPNEFLPEKYRPISFSIKQDTCESIDVESEESDNATKLNVCFYEHKLLLDPSNINKEHALSSVRLFESSLWHNFVYHNITTSGYASLANVNIAVKLLTR